MKAILLEQFGGIEQLHLKEFTTPTPGPNEVQIKIIYTAVNPVDWKIRMGLLQNRMPHEFPLIPGWDAAGTISAVGKNAVLFQPGDAVFAYCRKPTIQWGTYAEYICVPAEYVAFKPDNISFAQAAAIPLAGLTAWQSLFDKAQLKRGESILIQAGAGGVGSLAIQFAKYVGAYVYTTAAESNHNYVKKLGADIVIDYKKDNFISVIKDRQPAGVDVVFDTVGGQTTKDSYYALKPGGRLVSLLEPPNERLAEQLKIKASYIFVSPNGQQLQEISDLIAGGEVRPIHIEEMPLEMAGEAQEKNRLGQTKSKIVLKVTSDALSHVK